MGDYLRRHLAAYRRGDVGFALFLAWTYVVLFGCGLATPAPELSGTPAVYALEHIWLFNGLAEGLGGAVGIALARRAGTLPGDGRRTGCWLAMALGVVGSLVVWAAWLERTTWFWRLCLPGGLLVGGAVATFTMLWGATLSLHDEARIELVVPLSFAIAFACYLVLLFLRPSAVFNLFVAAGMCVASAALALPHPGQDDSRHAASPCRERLGRSDLTPFAVQTFACWTQVAFFRVLSTPAYLGNSREHFFYPFLGACLASIILVLVCLRMSRYLNVSLAYRWALPLFVASYVPLLVDYHDGHLRMLAYAINFLGMFGVQFGSWMGAAKFVRRARCRPGQVFARYALGEGAGIVAGCSAGLWAVGLPDGRMAAVGATMLAITELLVMTSGFNPSWVFRRSKGLSDRSAVEEPGTGLGCPRSSAAGGRCPRAATAGARPTPDTADLEGIFQEQAKGLATRFGLTARETEVTALLLAGRTRPFVRDELLVSLNTVNAHVRSIFGKCAVHSRQELIDLARMGSEKS